MFVACSHPRPRSRGCPALADTLWSSVRALRPAARSFCRPVEQLRLRALAAPHSPGSAPPRGSHASGQVPLWWLLRARETDAGGAATAGWVAGLWTAHSGQALASVEVRPRVSISALPGRGTVWQTPSPGPRICLGIPRAAAAGPGCRALSCNLPPTVERNLSTWRPLTSKDASWRVGHQQRPRPTYTARFPLWASRASLPHLWTGPVCRAHSVAFELGLQKAPGGRVGGRDGAGPAAQGAPVS